MTKPGQRAGQEGEVVPMRDLLEQREAAHAVAAELGLHMDVVDDLRREDPAMTKDEALRFRRNLCLRRCRPVCSFSSLAQPFALYSTSFFSVGSRLS
jgi:hypothetical protein